MSISRCAHCLALDVPRFDFRVFHKSTSQNELRSNHGAARFRYKAERTWWERALRDRMTEGVVDCAKARRIVRLTRELTGRERPRDYGNLVGGLKPVLDAMVRVGVLVDDSEQWLTDIYEQQRTTERCVRIEIWEVTT